MLLHKYWVTILNTDMFLEQQLGLLEWFLKGHVTLKTGVMLQFIFTTVINGILKYKLK